MLRVGPYTVNVDIFALYIFLRYSRFSNFRENIYNLKTSYIMPHRSNIIKNANLSPREIANFRKFAKIYTRENIYIHEYVTYRCYCVYFSWAHGFLYFGAPTDYIKIIGALWVKY